MPEAQRNRLVIPSDADRAIGIDLHRDTGSPCVKSAHAITHGNGFPDEHGGVSCWPTCTGWSGGAPGTHAAIPLTLAKVTGSRSSQFVSICCRAQVRSNTMPYSAIISEISLRS